MSTPTRLPAPEGRAPDEAATSATSASGWTVDVSRVTVVARGGDVAPLRPKERAVVAAIAFAHPQAASVADIAPLVWGDRIPATANKAIHNHVARLRQAIEGLIDTSAYGYRLAADVEVVENTTDPNASPYADLAATTAVDERRRAVREANAWCEEAEVESLLARGEHVAATPLLTELVRREPTRERRWWLLMLAQLRSGRRTDALATYADATDALAAVGRPTGTELDLLREHLVDDDPVVLSSTYLDRGRASGEAARSLAGGDPVVVPLPRAASIANRALEQALRPGAHPVVVTISGPAGSGKSTFVRTVVEDARRRGMHVYTAACPPTPGSPLEPFGELVARLAAADPVRLARIAGADALVSLLQDDGHRSAQSQVADRSILFDALSDALLGVGRPTCIVVEDTHFAGPLVHDVLAHLDRRRHDIVAPLVVVTTVRTEDTTGDDLEVARPALVAEHVIELGPWDVDTIGRYLATFDVSPTWARSAADWIHRRTAGNPLFVRELALVAATGGSARDEATANDAGPNDAGPNDAGPNDRFVAPDVVPDAVRTAVRHRVSLLSRHARSVGQAAAILGIRFRGADLATMVEATTAGLAEARALGIVQPADEPDVFEFRHQLYHRAVLESIGPAALVETSDLAWRALTRPDGGGARSGDIARHAVAAIALDLDRAVAATRTAAERSVLAHDRTGAAELWGRLRQAIADADGVDAAWCETSIEMGRHLVAAGDADGLDVLESVVDQAIELDRPDLAARATLEFCRLGPSSGAGTADPRAMALAGRVLATSEDPHVRALAAAAASMASSFTSETATTRSFFEEAEGEARRSGDPAVLAEVLPYAYMALSAPDDLERRESLALELADLAEQTDRDDLRWEAAHLTWSNRLQRGDGDVRRSVEDLERAAGRLSEQSRRWEMAYLRSTQALLDGRLDVAEAEITTSLTYEGAVGSDRVGAVAGAHLLAVHLARHQCGDLLAMAEHLAAEQPRVPAWTPAIALCGAAAGALDVARDAFDRAIADGAASLPRDHTFSAALLALGECAAILGDPARVVAAGDLLEPLAGRWSWTGTCTFGPIDLTRARLALANGDHDQAIRLAAGVLRSCADLRAPGWSADAVSVIETALDHR